MKNTTLTYAAATEMTAKEINRLIDGKESRVPEKIRHEWAFGAYLLWKTLFGVISDLNPDDARLRNLIGD